MLVDLVVSFGNDVDNEGVIPRPVGPDCVCIEVVRQGDARRDVVYPIVNPIVAVLLIGPEADSDSSAMIKLRKTSGRLKNEGYASTVVVRSDVSATTRRTSCFSNI